MISPETLGELFNYNYWARDRQLEACSKLSEQDFLRSMGNSFTSVQNTLGHLLGAEWIWHERLRGHSPRSLPAWLEDVRTVEAIRQRWRQVEIDMRDYLGGLTADWLVQSLTYVNLAGQTWTYEIWQVLLHLVNHQTYHRGQVTTMLRQLGATSPAIDFLVYYDMGKRAASSRG
jgi:uncharacterized damage-inducible protein DinB